MFCMFFVYSIQHFLRNLPPFHLAMNKPKPRLRVTDQVWAKSLGWAEDMKLISHYRRDVLVLFDYIYYDKYHQCTILGMSLLWFYYYQFWGWTCFIFHKSLPKVTIEPHLFKETLSNHHVPNTGWWFQTWLLFSTIYGMSSFPLTNSYFSEGWLNPQPG